MDVLAKTLEGIFIVGALAVLFFPLTVCVAGFIYEMGRWFHRWHVATRKPGYELGSEPDPRPHACTSYRPGPDGIACEGCGHVIPWDELPAGLSPYRPEPESYTR